MIRSQCDGNLDCFLLAFFSLYNPRKERNGMGKKLGSFENFEVSLGSCLFKMHLSFSKIVAWTLDWDFIMVSFYSDIELMHKLGK